MNFLLGVTGGIAAYKAADLASVLVNKTKDDVNPVLQPVQIVMTEAAKRIITPLTLATISKRPVLDDIAEWSGDGHIWHIELAKWTGIFIVVPATANTIAKMAQGIADNLLTSIYLALPKDTPVVIFPAMNTKMWENPQTQKNITELYNRPWHKIVDPEVGLLACGDIGKGKLPSVKTMAEAIWHYEEQNASCFQPGNK